MALHGHGCRVADICGLTRGGVCAQRGRAVFPGAQHGGAVFPRAQHGSTQGNPYDHSPQGNPYDHSPFSSKSPFSVATPAIDAYDTWTDQQRVHTAGERTGGKWSPMLAGARPHTVSNHRSWEAVRSGPTDSPTPTRRPAYCEGNYWHWGTSEQAHRLRHTRIHDLPVMSRWRLPSAREGPGCPAVTCWGTPVRHPWREKPYYKQGRVGEQQLFRTVANALITASG